MRALRILPAALLALTGCVAVSRTHIGFYNVGDSDLRNSVVGEKYVASFRDQEEQWMGLVARLDLDALSEHFAPGLAEKMNAKIREKLVVQIQRDYHPNGYFRRRRFETPALSASRTVLADPFGLYDMLGYAYQMEGKVEAGVQFYVTKVEGELKICGIEIRPANESDREKAKDVLFVFPETSDKDRIEPPR